MSLDFTDVTLLESRGRTTQIGWEGLEIQREFVVSPHTSGPAVVEALQGSVYQDENKQWIRRLPAVDPYYPYCYCNEAQIDHVDLGKDSIGVSPSLEFAPDKNEFDIPNVKNYVKVMNALNGVGERPAGGCFVTASYRPLISAYEPDTEQDLELSKMFDWVDPQWNPGVKTVEWPDGMAVGIRSTVGVRQEALDAIEQAFGALGKAIKDVLGLVPQHTVRGLAAVPKGVGGTISVPIIDFSIRRLLVGKVPWKEINDKIGSVNRTVWPQDDHIKFNELFPKGTLRFDAPEILEHYSPATPGKYWYEIIYHFQWLNLISKPGGESDVFDHQGNIDKTGVVTWNHVLMSPDRNIIDTWGLSRNNPGWFFAQKINLAGWTPWVLDAAVPALAGELAEPVGPVYKLADFHNLFDLQAD